MAHWSKILAVSGLALSAAIWTGLAAAQPSGAKACDRIVGVWTWVVNGDVTFLPDGTLTQGKLSGRWFCDAGRGQVAIVWNHGYTDIVSVSEDGQRVSGTNNIGGKVGGVRKTASAKPGSDPQPDRLLQEFFKRPEASAVGPWAGAWSRMEAAVTLKPIENDPKRGALGIRIGGTLRAVSLLLPQAKGGAYVVTVNSDAAAAGIIQRGDVVTAVNGQAVRDIRHLVQLVSGHPPGATLRVEFWRMPGGFEGLQGALYKAAQSDDANATFLLGYLETFPEGGGTADSQRLFGFYHRAAVLGSVDAMEETANAYRNGTGVEANLPEAAQWYRQAVERGSASAMFGLATLVATGKVGEANPAEIFALMQRSADGGHALAFYFLASYHDAGFGTNRDPEAAARVLIDGVRRGGSDLVARFGAEKTWTRSAEFYLALQRRLAETKVYRGPLDGKPNAQLEAALGQLAQMSR